MLLFRIVKESYLMAAGQLLSNKLRSFLSLLGISIGIFCIVAVLSAVDSLQQSIVSGFSELGSTIVYIDKQPWTEDPGANYWKYLKRPNPTVNDYEAIKRKSKLAANTAYCYFNTAGTVKYKNNSVQGGFMMGSSPEYMEVQKLEVEQGRYLTQTEFNNGSNVTVLGAVIAKSLFGELDPIGREVKILGQKFRVIGVLKEEGDNPFNFMNFDEVVHVSLKTAQKFYNVSDPFGRYSGGQLLLAAAKEGVDLEELKSELTGILRSARRIRPMEEENFALNQTSMLEDAIGGVFGVLNIAGGLIGVFSLIVGMISVANIMFVSVKERTGMIGVKKALGAKQYFILMEFLLEAIFLCLIGGIIGLLLVMMVLKAISSVIPFEMAMSANNLILGIGTSIVVGILAGVIPAYLASKLDPVEAMRQ